MCGFTFPHCVDGVASARVWYGLRIHIVTRLNGRNPKKIRHLRVYRGCLFCVHASGRTRAETPSHSGGRLGGFERDIRGEGRRNQGLRHSLILVVTPARAGEASRALHPLRSGASECSANGRSATRSDSQRSNGRTRWDGHPAWGSKRGHTAPSRAADQPTGGRWEKNGGSNAPTSV